MGCPINTQTRSERREIPGTQIERSAVKGVSDQAETPDEWRKIPDTQINVPGGGKRGDEGSLKKYYKDNILGNHK